MFLRPRTHQKRSRSSRLNSTLKVVIQLHASNSKRFMFYPARPPSKLAGSSEAWYGGQARIRTLEADGNRFTVCPLWPLGYLPQISAAQFLRRGSRFASGIMMGKEEQASPRTAPPSLKLRKKVMSSRSSLVQETADSIDEVVRSQEGQEGIGHFSRH